jgi:hypothetical protein
VISSSGMRRGRHDHPPRRRDGLLSIVDGDEADGLPPMHLLRAVPAGTRRPSCSSGARSIQSRAGSGAWSRRWTTRIWNE